MAALTAACSSVPSGVRVGDEFVQRGRCPEAIEAYTGALSEDDTVIDAYLGRGGCYESQGEWDRAADDYVAALRLEKSERTLVALAKVRVAQKQFDRADALLLQLVASADGKKTRMRYKRRLAELRLLSGNAREAVILLREILDANPKDNETRIVLGRALVSTRQHQEAINVLSEALAIARDRNELKGTLICEVGRAMEAIERYEDALRSYRWCGKLDPALADAKVGEGRLLRKTEEVESAIEVLRVVVRQHPNSPEAHYELGLAYRSYGILELAVAELEIATNLDPAFVDPYPLLLNLLSEEVRDPKRRYAVLSRAASVLRDNFDVQLDFGRAAVRRRDVKPAFTALARAVQLTPNHTEANFYYGVAQAALGKLEEATDTVEALGVVSPEQALELSEIVNGARKGRDPIAMLGVDPSEKANGKVGRDKSRKTQKKSSRRKRKKRRR